MSLSPLPAVAENVPNATQPDALVFDLKAGEVISVASLVNKIDSQDIVLLGELHDNPAHHLARAHIIELLACVHCVIVSEHLPANHKVSFSSNLFGSLESAGFDAKGWAWPLHEPLFKVIQSKNIPLMGGNIPSALSSDLFKRGEAAIPASLLQQYQKSALSISAQKKLDQDLKEGHCGHLSDPYLPPMRLIQRIKDASFAELLLDHSPSILIAGNGHVRKDYGVAQILGALAPNIKVLSVGFIEQEDWTPEAQQSLSELYDVVWVSQNTPRSDPCKDFAAPHLKN